MVPDTPKDRSARKKMVAQALTRANPPVTDPRVLQAMESIPRHPFVPDPLRHQAYENRPLPIGQDQTISQPYIVAWMTEWLQVRPGLRLLEIGTGCGYQTAILSELGADIVSIEFDPDLSARAAQCLHDLGHPHPRLLVGDGFHPPDGTPPFDRIISTCATRTPPTKTLESLRTGGRAIIPVGPLRHQTLIGYQKTPAGLTSEILMNVRFVENRAEENY